MAVISVPYGGQDPDCMPHDPVAARCRWCGSRSELVLIRPTLEFVCRVCRLWRVA